MRSVENSITSEAERAKSFLDRMQFFYELFPYPGRPVFLRPNPNGSLEAHAGFSAIVAQNTPSLSEETVRDLKLRDVRHAFPSKKKIALVGCGTDEPLLFRVLHPHNPIVGFDLSLKSLLRAERKIRWHQLKPVDFEHGDANHSLALSGTFDHIQCFGVLHHQPEPKKLMKTMSNALNPGGTLRLMIYSSNGRRLERGVQKKFLGLWEAKPSATTNQENTAGAMAPSKGRLMLASFKLSLWRALLPVFARKSLSLRFRYLGLSPARIADAFLHPSDHALSLAETLAWADGNGLQLVYHRAKSYDLGVLCSHSTSNSSLQTLVSEEESGNIASNIILVFKKVGGRSWIST
jgi:SAM-dependent methyltransferase